jgi:hypothetical protein
LWQLARFINLSRFLTCISRWQSGCGHSTREVRSLVPIHCTGMYTNVLQSGCWLVSSRWRLHYPNRGLHRFRQAMHLTAALAGELTVFIPAVSRCDTPAYLSRSRLERAMKCSPVISMSGGTQTSLINQDNGTTRVGSLLLCLLPVATAAAAAAAAASNATGGRTSLRHRCTRGTLCCGACDGWQRKLTSQVLVGTEGGCETLST